MLHVIKHFTPRKDGWWFIGFWWNRINWRWAKVYWISCLSFRPKDSLHEDFYLALREEIQSLCNMSALVSLISLPRQYCPLGLQFLLEFFLPWWRISGALIRVTVSFLDMILEEGKQPIGHSRRLVGWWGDKLTDLGMNSRKEKAWEIRSWSLICAQKLFLECLLHGGGNLACFFWPWVVELGSIVGAVGKIPAHLKNFPIKSEGSKIKITCLEWWAPVTGDCILLLGNSAWEVWVAWVERVV